MQSYEVKKDRWQMHLINIYLWIFFTLQKPACSVTMTAAALSLLMHTVPYPVNKNRLSTSAYGTIAIVGRV